MTSLSVAPTPFDARDLGADIQCRRDRPTPYRSRLRWPDSATGARVSVSHSQGSAEQAYAWTALLVEAAQGGLDPRLVTRWLTMLTETTCGALDPALAGASLAEYGDANMELILRGLQPKSHSVYLEGWRLRVVPTLGHLPPALVIPGVLDRAVHGWIADGLSASVIKNALAILGRTLEQARRDGLIEVNPTPVKCWQKQFQLAQDELDEPRNLALPDWDTLRELAEALVTASHSRYRGWGEVVTAAACTAVRSSWARRSRKSASTLWWKPGSSSSMAMAYLKSMRQRTASAAWRSDRPSRNCSTQTVASCAGESPGRPSRGYQPAKSSSHHSPSNRSLTHIAVVPPGLLARAIRAVREGTCSPERGWRDNEHLGSCIGL